MQRGKNLKSQNVNGVAPRYLQELCTCPSGGCPWSTMSTVCVNSLHFTASCSYLYWTAKFRIQRPAAWNNLPPTLCKHMSLAAFKLKLTIAAQLSQRDRAAASVSYGQKWKTGTESPVGTPGATTSIWSVADGSDVADVTQQSIASRDTVRWTYVRIDKSQSTLPRSRADWTFVHQPGAAIAEGMRGMSPNIPTGGTTCFYIKSIYTAQKNKRVTMRRGLSYKQVQATVKSSQVKFNHQLWGQNGRIAMWKWNKIKLASK